MILTGSGGTRVATLSDAMSPAAVAQQWLRLLVPADLHVGTSAFDGLLWWRTPILGDQSFASSCATQRTPVDTLWPVVSGEFVVIGSTTTTSSTSGLGSIYLKVRRPVESRRAGSDMAGADDRRHKLFPASRFACPTREGVEQERVGDRELHGTHRQEMEVLGSPAGPDLKSVPGCTATYVWRQVAAASGGAQRERPPRRQQLLT